MSGLASGIAIQASSPSNLPTTPAARVQAVFELLQPEVVDDEGRPTGEFGPPLISKELARKLLEGVA